MKRGGSPSVMTVTELTYSIKGMLEQNFTRVLVRGEVSGFRGANARGHLYFTLKDADAQVDAKIWASQAHKLKFRLRDGLSVVAEGYVDLYPPQGRYSLIVQKLEPEGEGALALAFAQLKERLTSEGLMGEGRKRAPRPLPRLPRRIGVVTSRTGAALQDFLRVLHARHPWLSVLVADARVQGEGSAEEVVRAIRHLSQTDVDVVVVTRGGGSVEDLWTFNEEAVARAIFDCPVPVVSAIGHEVDFTIADFVADFRAPTPSAAAERLAPVLSELELSLATLKHRLKKSLERNALVQRRQLEGLRARLSDPRRLLGTRRLHISSQAEALISALRAKLRASTLGLRTLSFRLARQRPEVRLARQRTLLASLARRLARTLRDTLSTQRSQLAHHRIRLERSVPRARISSELSRMKFSRSALTASLRGRLEAERQRTSHFAAVLHHLSPLAVMARGYAVAFDARGRVIRRAAEASVGDELSIRLLPPELPGEPTLKDAEEIRAKVTSVKVLAPEDKLS